MASTSDVETPNPGGMAEFVKVARKMNPTEGADFGFCCWHHSSMGTEMIAGINRRSRVFLKANRITQAEDLMAALRSRLGMEPVSGGGQIVTVLG